MPGKKKRKTSLPRVTLLAMNRRELVDFVSAVENLRLLVDDLRLILMNRPKKKPAAVQVAANPPAGGQPT